MLVVAGSNVVGTNATRKVRVVLFDTGAYDIRLASTYVLGWIGDGAWQARARDWAGERGE
jgi:hypothetical protein